ncbi:hypothetical protein P175DRAFT_0484402 [Aspergillus ochraceoroseus IBT 24754]|uniref:DNA (cytosine-5-)-methyltransferase n=2 Tax=Aspergillus ochraceoroseus TaxID=138278 RepID=A0A2T5LRB4_9EURO|nr:uncharacterized protein P175DRAFT_0484402 [Aspergillus ochraceoroseus IBT 24754]KKK23317.1 hypothetical protein AOCH_005845 [Aspergillus ochraceoroseus]PTU18821.1 hypothetical protein P175DRAFT_0484402 [Aspergillus ochraceoroseus IBT 24754]
MTEPTHLIGDDDSDTSSVTIDNDPDRLYLLSEADFSSPATPFLSPGSTEIVDLTEISGEALLDGDYVTDECVEILREDWKSSVRVPKSPPQAATPSKKFREDACVDGIVYMPGQSVELHDDTFLRISAVWEDSRGEVYFDGRRLLRAKGHVGTYIPKWSNELIWVANETMEIALGLVRRFVNIHFTSCCHIDRDEHKISRPGDLFCRLKEIPEGDMVSVEYVSYHDADPGYAVEARILRQSWRGETQAFGSRQDSQQRCPVIVLDEIEETPPHWETVHARDGRKYTFGDGFCGAGGVSCGAQNAGLSLHWAFDLSPDAATTYRLNFDTVECETSDIFSFLTNDEAFLRVDITHGSPPCQTFSPAHTVESKNDDANSACIFSCGNLIRKAKPRVHTMEETSGLFERHKETFYGVIQDFIETGYSVRWAVLNCMEYGVPQSRKRLIIIASGPGETLPSLPKPTHGLPGSGLQKLTTINQMISNIPAGTPDHDVDRARSRAVQNQRIPFDANQQARTITCGGGDNNYHPSGKRGFTNREFACLQTFPLTFRFGPREVRKQIGNAVPPVLARTIYGEIVRSLQETDARELHALIHGGSE